LKKAERKSFNKHCSLREVLMRYPKLSASEFFLRLLFPARCICCGIVLPVNVQTEICGECEKDIKYLAEFVRVCPASSCINRIYSVFEYAGGIRKAVHRLKFGETPRNASVLVDLSYPLLENFLNEQSGYKFFSKYDIIVPAPLHPKRKRQRGYNQSELVAARLSYHMKIPVLKNVLVKRVNTVPQSRLTREERLKNLVGVFDVTKPELICGRRILLVDDIMTTGSTLEQCARMLADAGAADIDAYVIAVRHRLWRDSLAQFQKNA